MNSLNLAPPVQKMYIFRLFTNYWKNQIKPYYSECVVKGHGIKELATSDLNRPMKITDFNLCASNLTHT